MAKFYAPIIACTLIDAINRAAIATGSCRSAMIGEKADYNGHHVVVRFNNYRKYYTAEYMWAGRVVIARGGLAECVHAAMREYRRGAKGASVEIVTEAGDEFQVADYPEIVEGDFDAYRAEHRANAPWWASEVHFALEHRATHHLMEATSREDFLDRYFGRGVYRTAV